MTRVIAIWLVTLVVLTFSFVLSRTGLGLTDRSIKIDDTRAPTRSGCFGRNDTGVDNTWSQEACTYGSTNSLRTIVLVGDSTAASLSDGVIAAINDLDIRLIVFPSRGCPFATRQPYSYEWCTTFFADAMNLLRKVNPDGLIISNYLSRMDLEDRRIPNADGSLPETLTERLNSTVTAFSEALSIFAEEFPSAAVLIVHEIPKISVARKPTVLFDRSTKAEVIRNSRSLLRQNEYIAAINQVMRTHKQISALDPQSLLCNPKICSAKTIDGRLLYLDDYHLNPTGSLLFAPSIRKWIVAEISLNVR